MAWVGEPFKETRSHFVEVLPEGGIATLEARLRARGRGAALQTPSVIVH